jgi:DNA-binding NtrC family response regulator
MGRLLLIHKNAETGDMLLRHLHASEHEIKVINEYKHAIDLVDKFVFDVVVCDISLANGTGGSFLKYVKKSNANTMVIITTGRENTENAIRLIDDGAFDFIQEPIRYGELDMKLQRALDHRRQLQEMDSLRGERNIIYDAHNFIGESPKIKKIFEIVSKVSKSNSTILLTGETGTGKELIAGAIHYNSHRAKQAFVKVNCAALPEQLLESELFGHEKGAFTGAEKQRVGRFEQADGGSLFLDEIGDMSLTTQAKVLRVLQEREFERVGSSKTISVDVRIIVATNKDLHEEIKKNKFREDLFYRLNVVTIDVPPLRERKGDILLLSYFFLKKYCGDLKKSLKELHPRTIKTITEYQWPGNIRELQNTIERAVLMSEGKVVQPEDLGLHFKMERVNDEQRYIRLPPGGIRLEEVEKELVMQALKMSDWIQKDAAELLGISGRVLNYKIKRFNITHPQWKRNKT